jgi:UrcA family protein
MTTRIIRQALFALAFAGSCLTGYAETLDATARTATVRFADLNLNNSEGVRILYARIRAAAETVCGTRWSVWDHRQVWAWRECYRTTLDDAVRRINQPLLTDLHRNLVNAPPG